MSGARLAPLLVLVFLVALVPSAASAQFTSTSLAVNVYADGSAHVTQVLAANSSDVSISVQLLSPILTDAVAVDQSGSPLSFQISGSNITIYTLGSTGVTLQYDTEALTDKQGTVWTLNFTSPYNVTAVLPEQAMVTSVSPTPESFSEADGSPVVTVGPGEWLISYGVPIALASSSGSTSSSASSVSTSTVQSSTTTQTSGSQGQTQSQEVFYGSIAALVAAALVVGLFLFRRSRRSLDLGGTNLRPDDVQVLNFIAEKGGKVFEPEIRTRFVLPKTSAWRQIKRLERLGYVRISKVGSQNQIELLKSREKPDG